jgi:hypothetical protein
MMHSFFKRNALIRSISYTSSSPHIIDGITQPRTPPAARSADGVFIPQHPDVKPLWLQTHSVFNQSPALQDFDALASDLALSEFLGNILASSPQSEVISMKDAVAKFAVTASSRFVHELAFLAHSNPPVLSTHDRTGVRRDQVDYHPSYHRLMAFGIENRVPSLAHVNQNTSAAMACRCVQLVFASASYSYYMGVQVGVAVSLLPSGAWSQLPSHHDLCSR